MSALRTLVRYLAIFLVLPVTVGAWGVSELLTRERPALLPRATGSLLAAVPRPAIDPSRPTVVVLLGADVTEVTDALGPYEMFVRVGRFNVVTAAPQRRPTRFTGGLALLPHYSLSEIDAALRGHPADIVVVPNIPNVTLAANAPIVAWLQKQAAAGALMHSWCKGAMALAEAGLLDGKRATAHWGDIDKLERRYPLVRWLRGVRWLEHDGFVISAGITSGIDASLRLIGRWAGDATARRVAREIRYPNYHYALDPRAPQLTLEAADAVLLVKAAFAVRERVGLALYEGIGELDLSNVYDAHAYVMAADVEAVAEAGAFVQSAHGLTLLPALVADVGQDVARIAKLERLLVPGPRVERAARSLLEVVKSHAPSARVQYLHAHQPERFGLEPALEDLARSADVATARFALRRMEYRSQDVRLQGQVVPWRELARFLSLGMVGVLVFVGLGRRIRGHRRVRGTSASLPCHAPARADLGAPG